MNDANDSTPDLPLPATVDAPANEAAPTAPVRRPRAPRKKIAAEASASVTPEANAAIPPAPAPEPASTPVFAPEVSQVMPQAMQPAAVGASSVELGDQPGPQEVGASGDGAEAGESGSHRGGRRGRGRDRQRGRRDAEGDVASAGASAGARPELGARVQEVFDELITGAFDAEPAVVEPAPEVGVPESTGGATNTENTINIEHAESTVSPEAAAQAKPSIEHEAAALADAAQHKRVLSPEPDAPKLHKVLAQAGVGSRRDLEQMILDGRVTVNDEPAHVGQRISFGDQVRVEGKLIKVRISPPPPRVLAYHKPVGEVVTHDDPQHRPTVFRRLPKLFQGKWQSVGRLDINTEGLLLFTSSGELANQLMHPRFGVEREYAVRVLGALDETARALLLEGVQIDGQTASFKSIEDGGGEGANRWYRVVITEGRNREVRKLFEAAGLAVSRLIRVRYGCVVLPRGLKRGAWVELDERDVRLIRQLAGGGNNQGQRHPQQGKGQGQQRSGGGQQGQGKQGGSKQGPFGQQGHKHGGQQQAQQGQRGPKDNNKQQRRGHAPGGQRYEGSDMHEDPLHIPNPLEQTFDRRFASGSQRISRGFGQPSHDYPSGPKKGNGPRQPDPMQTSVGYIGADAFFSKANGPRGNKRGGGRGGFGGR